MSDMPDYVRALYTSVKNTWQDAENLDDTHGYTTYVWIPEETFKVDIMKLHVFAEKFRAYSKAAASGGGTVVTSAAGGGTTVTSEYTSIPHTHDVTIGNHTHNVTIPNHTHDVNIGTKTSTSESTHKHIIAEAPETGTFTPDAYMDVFDVNGAIIASINVKRYATATPYTIGDAQAHSHNVNYGTKTSSAGGGTTVTSAAGGGTTVTSASGGGSHSHNVTIPNHTHDVTIPNHTHNVVIGTKTSASESTHKHQLSGSLGEGTYTPDGYMNIFSKDLDLVAIVNVKRYASKDPWVFSGGDPHTHNVVIGTVTSASGGGTTVTSAAGGGTTVTSASGGGTTVTSAAGGGTTVTSASGGGSHRHTVSGQTTSTQDNHTHDVVIGTVTSASGGGSHSHDVTIPDHTHDITYGIYEEAITGRTLSAILYDPDGNLLKDFGVVCTGEDSQIIDLSDYFSTLKYGMYHLELTASGRLRARLIFYELCKMYAI